MAKVNRVERTINRWLTTPETNAAGRLGLYRIIYAVTALLLILSLNQYSSISEVPSFLWNPVPIIRWMNEIPPAAYLVAIEVIYISALVLLGIGLRVRLMTLIVLIAGTIYASITFSFGKIDHSDTFLRVYIPMVMLFAPWGQTYSLDAFLARRQGHLTTSIHEDGLRYSWPILFLLCLLSVMFMTSGLIKAIPPGQWILDPDLMRKFMLEYNLGSNPVWIRHVLAHTPLVPTLLMWITLLFEIFFPLALINKTWRRFMLSSAIFFHIGTGFGLGIQFTPLLFFYILFFDLQALYDRFFPKGLPDTLSRSFANFPTPVLIGLTLLTAAITVLSHYFAPTIQLWNLIFESIWAFAWWVAAPIALYGLITSAPTLIRSLRQRRVPQTQAP